MRRPSGSRGLSCLLTAALSVAWLPGCKNDDPAGDPPPADAKASEDAKAGDDAKATQDEPKEEGPPPKLEVSAEPAPSYPAALDGLLDIVPEDQESFFVVRDPARAIAAIGSVFGSQSDAVGPIMSALSKAPPDKLAAAMKGFATAFEGSPVELGKGIVVLPEVGEGVVVYASSEADALPKLVSKLTGEPLKAKCAKLDNVEGYVACTGEKGAVPKDLTPGKKSADRSKLLAEAMVGLELDRAMVAGRIKTPGGEALSFSLEPSGGQAVFTFSHPQLAQVGSMISPGPAKLLGLLNPGTGFLWAHASEGGLEQAKKSVPPLAAGPVASLSGEGMFGTTADPQGLLVALAVSDPAPLRGGLELASGQLANIPPSLPDGTKIKAEAKELEGPSGPFKTIHAALSGSKELQPLLDAGFKPEFFAFVADSFAAVYAGGDEAGVKKLAAYSGGGPSQAFVDRLPTAAAADLAAGKVSMMTYVPVDGMSSEAFREFGKTLAQQGGAGGVDPATYLNTALVVLAPFSSFTMWTRHEGDNVAIRLGVQAFADGDSEEGKAANEAIAAFLGGADATKAFGGLVKAYPDSPRLPSYKVRAGESQQEAVSGAFIIGMFAAVAIPAFQKYIERSRAAGAGAPPAVKAPPPGK